MKSHFVWICFNCPCLQEKGVEIEINGSKITVYGALATVCADNLGSCALGGFKEGSTAYRFCRQCLTKYEDIRQIVSVHHLVVYQSINMCSNWPHRHSQYNLSTLTDLLL